MRTYGQYCAMAKALDVIGDRWTLLIVRELMLRGGCRYVDLQRGLPGIATNLLAERLRAMEAAGLTRREAAPPPIATTLFHLTDRGRSLRPVMGALGRWGAPLLAATPEDDAFHSYWLALPIEELLTDHEPDGPPIVIEVRTGDQPLAVRASAGLITAGPSDGALPNAVLSGDRAAVLRVLMGRWSVAQGREHGVTFDGDPKAFARVQPGAFPG